MTAKTWTNGDRATADDLDRWESSAAVIKVDTRGAVGDGSADDAAAINQAILDAAKTGLPIRVQLMPNAVHVFKSPINAASDVHIDGNGATLKWEGTVDRPLSMGAVTNVQVSDLTLDLGGSPPSSGIWSSLGADRLSFHRVKVISGAVTGAAFRLNNTTNSEIVDCQVQGSGNAYNISGGSFNQITRSLATDTPAGILVNPNGTNPATDVDVIGCTVKDFPDGVVLSYPIRSAGLSTVSNQRVRFIGCTVIGKQGIGYIDGSTPGGTADQINAVWTDGMTFLGCTSRYGGDMGFSFSNCTMVTMTGCLAEYNTAVGLCCAGGNSFVTITGNTSMNNGQNWNNHAPNAVARAGIGSSTSTTVTITGNTVGDNQTTPTQDYGIRLQLNGDNTTIAGNVYQGNKTAKFYTDGTHTNINNMDASSATVFGNRVAFQSVAANSVTALAATTWAALTGTPTITLPNDGGIYRLDLHGMDAQLSVTGQLNIGLTGDGGVTWIKQSTHAHGTGVADRVHLSAGNVIGAGQTVTVWGYSTVAATATLHANASSPLELWATRIG